MNDGTLFELRGARDSDFALARGLYLGTMKSLLSKLDAWNPEEFSGRITRSFKPDEVRIIVRRNRDIGFLHLIETDGDINIAQLHLADAYRGLGIGTRILHDLIARAEREGKSVSLSAPRNNPAIRLYKRLGFKISRDNGEAIIDMIRALPAGNR